VASATYFGDISRSWRRVRSGGGKPVSVEPMGALDPRKLFDRTLVESPGVLAQLDRLYTGHGSDQNSVNCNPRDPGSSRRAAMDMAASDTAMSGKIR
jgi:hypothetical protein